MTNVAAEDAGMNQDLVRVKRQGDYQVDARPMGGAGQGLPMPAGAGPVVGGVPQERPIYDQGVRGVESMARQNFDRLKPNEIPVYEQHKPAAGQQANLQAPNNYQEKHFKNPSVGDSLNRNGESNRQQPQQVNDQTKRKKTTPIKIAESEECAQDVKTFCSENSQSNNFAVLECLQSDEKVSDLQNIGWWH